jgi:hypothetical protein
MRGSDGFSMVLNAGSNVSMFRCGGAASIIVIGSVSPQ